MIDRLAPGFTVVVTGGVVLLPVFGSCVGLDTVAVLVSEPTVAAAAVGFTTIVIVALCPFVMVPSVHVTVAVPLHVPSVVVVDTHVAFTGNVSVTSTFVAVLGPAFPTVRV